MFLNNTCVHHTKHLHVKVCVPTDLYEHMEVCPVVCRSRGLKGSLQFNPNEWGHYVSAYDTEKLYKWIRCYSTMLLLSKHKQRCTNVQMFTMSKYDEIHPRGGIHDYTVCTHTSEDCASLQKACLGVFMNHRPRRQILNFNEISFLASAHRCSWKSLRAVCY